MSSRGQWSEVRGRDALSVHTRIGRFGADEGAAGVAISVLHPDALVTVIARKGKAKVVRDTLSRMKTGKVMWAGAEQYYVQGVAAAELKAKFGDDASIIDQSHGRVVIRVSGPKARAVLAKGTPVDLHTDQFAVGQSAMTLMGHFSVHITRTGAEEFEISAFRSFAASLWEFITGAAEEFGYDVV